MALQPPKSFQSAFAVLVPVNRLAKQAFNQIAPRIPTGTKSQGDLSTSKQEAVESVGQATTGRTPVYNHEIPILAGVWDAAFSRTNTRVSKSCLPKEKAVMMSQPMTLLLLTFYNRMFVYVIP